MAPAMIGTSVKLALPVGLPLLWWDVAVGKALIRRSAASDSSVPPEFSDLAHHTGGDPLTKSLQCYGALTHGFKKKSPPRFGCRKQCEKTCASRYIYGKSYAAENCKRHVCVSQLGKAFAPIKEWKKKHGLCAGHAFGHLSQDHGPLTLDRCVDRCRSPMAQGTVCHHCLEICKVVLNAAQAYHEAKR
mmetsp:Transcript_39091/g.110858  ORF Transcript_39091/g.110858 Transcript_39091/m.110858 type:complete len:188 (-) Transcript_39091:223-786(-)